MSALHPIVTHREHGSRKRWLVITIQQIRLDSLDNAESVKARLDEGKDFGTVAASL